MTNSELIDAMSLYPTLEDLKVENEGLFKQVMISGGHKQMSNHYGKSIWFNQQDNVIALYRVQGLFESYIGLISTNKNAYNRHMLRLEELKNYDKRTKFDFVCYRKLTLPRQTTAMLNELLREDNLPPNKAFHLRFDTILEPWVIDRLNNYNPTFSKDSVYWEAPMIRVKTDKPIIFESVTDSTALGK